MTPGRALVVDDDIVSRLVLSRLLRRSEWVVEEVEDVPEALAALAGGVFDLIVSDYRLSSGTGIDILASLDGLADPPPFVLVTGILERVGVPSGVETEVAARLTKPVSSEALRRAIVSIERERRL
ncbi:response regulator receiver domain-containing protein [Rathayibacter tanaceti]|uniref:Response regulator n=2 Tax=Rathayibacter tanaceti TaxID=1671680 RepID=A0AAE6RKY1_9MICO|nr:response regulator [Rathayibacter tanaceti]QHC56604.1 response regulator [Rathayibacter tanaceti]TCO36256.1 response regulator receiver domain-containing protein [Rathayibacter tanaceti]